ncbi:ZPR1 zinc finger domain-containing protein [Candidatus Woesearchaeota archaeon]|nr:ZPR1 zinc finger domain-containing protein [Candidatus Woesearchaeota archaeon]
MAKTAKESQPQEGAPEVVEGELCPVCGNKTLTLQEMERDIPYFGKIFLFSMSCGSCDFHKADLETENSGNPVKIVFEISCEDDMKVRVVKSSEAKIKLPRITTIDPGPASNGYVTNVEGVLNRVKTTLENVRDNAEDKEERTKAKNLLKKLRKIMWGEEKLQMTIEDPSGNSAIVSDKAQVSKLK